jgi:hypothetical protein
MAVALGEKERPICMGELIARTASSLVDKTVPEESDRKYLGEPRRDLGCGINKNFRAAEHSSSATQKIEPRLCLTSLDASGVRVAGSDAGVVFINRVQGVKTFGGLLEVVKGSSELFGKKREGRSTPPFCFAYVL